MIKGKTIVKADAGIHARPAAMIATLVRKSNSEVIFRMNDVEVDPGNYIKLLSSRIKKGAEVEITVNGSDENEIFEDLLKILDTM